MSGFSCFQSKYIDQLQIQSQTDNIDTDYTHVTDNDMIDNNITDWKKEDKTFIYLEHDEQSDHFIDYQQMFMLTCLIFDLLRFKHFDVFILRY